VLISDAAQFDYLHRKQTGGSGQYGRVMGDYLPIDWSLPNQFTNATVGMNIGPDFIPAIEKVLYADSLISISPHFFSPGVLRSL
jgi:translation elongation factor EF-G